MATLTGNTIASTYTGLLSVTGAVGADTVEAVTDGAGTSTSLSLSQQRATITLGSGAADDFIVDGTTLVVEGDNNRVGIGTTSPDGLLHVFVSDVNVAAATDADDFIIENNASSADAGMSILTKNTRSGLIFFGDGDSATVGRIQYEHANDYMRFDTAGNERMRITSNGTVQINNGVAYSMSNNAGNGTLNGLWAGGSDQLNVGNDAGWDSIRFLPGSAEKMRIESDGNVSIGTTDAINDFGTGRTTLTLKGTGAEDYSVIELASYGTGADGHALGYIYFYDGSSQNALIGGFREAGTGDANLRFYTSQSGGSVTERMRIKRNGQVLVENMSGDVSGDDFNALWVNQRKTTGTSSSSHNIRGIYNRTTFEDADQSFGSMLGIQNVVINESAGSAECVQIHGIDSTVQMKDGDVNYLRGLQNFVNFDAGIVDNNIIGLYNLTEIASGGTISGSVYAIENDYDADTNPGGVMYGYYAVGRSNNDYHILTYSTTQSSVTFRLGDNGSVEHEQTITSGASLDYAEYFESKDGKSIAIGATVKLDDGKIVACEEGDTPIGVVRPLHTSAVVGGSQPFHWQGMYETDDYGGYVMESFTMTKWEEEVDVDTYLKTKETDGGALGGSIKKEHYDENNEKKYVIKYRFHTDRIPSDLTVPSDARVVEDKNKRKKINSDYDHSKTDSYKDREQRDEWHIVGLLGQIQITKGQPLSSSWIKMKDVSDTVELYFVK